VDVILSAFNETLAALRAAEKAVASLQTVNLSNFTEDSTVKAFGAAESLIAKSFESFNVCFIPYIPYYIALNSSRIARCSMGAEAVRAFRRIPKGHGTYGTDEWCA
jgi:hypothetical protein